MPYALSRSCATRQTKEVSMRKVVATELVSLDGVMEKPQEWSFSYSNAEMDEANAAGMANSAGHAGGAASR